jgi:predicted lipoprotein with Yx(FWY)xxD motif
MNKNTVIWIVVILVIGLGGWYYWSSMNGSYGNSSSQVQTQTQGAVLNISNDNATLGSYLSASNGMTLYYFTKDAPGVSTCADACAINWPPYTVSSSASLSGAAGVTGAISTITRADGSMQVTYNGAPLYFWAKDVKPGDTNGQNIGGVWFVVKP